MKENIKKAFDLASNEVEEKQIESLKNIIKNVLQKKKDKEKEIDELQEEVKILKQDIDDFKSGRLDKIKERHEINPKANLVAPITIIILNDNRRQIYPIQPWLWGYEVTWSNYPVTPNGYLTPSFGGGNLVNYSNATSLAYIGTGTSCAVNATGTYAVNGNIINL